MRKKKIQSHWNGCTNNNRMETEIMEISSNTHICMVKLSYFANTFDVLPIGNMENMCFISLWAMSNGICNKCNFLYYGCCNCCLHFYFIHSPLPIWIHDLAYWWVNRTGFSSKRFFFLFQLLCFFSLHTCLAHMNWCGWLRIYWFRYGWTFF